jgi:hypothetical protein
VNAALEKLFAISADEVIGHDKRKLIQEKICWKFANSEEFKRRVLATYDDNTYIEHFQCQRLPHDRNAGIWLEHWSQPIEAGPYAGGRLEHYSEIAEPGSQVAAAEAARRAERGSEGSAKQLAGSLSELIESARRGLDGSLDPDSALREIRSVVERLEDIVDDE